MQERRKGVRLLSQLLDAGPGAGGQQAEEPARVGEAKRNEHERVEATFTLGSNGS